jgi:F-type H+-transporting ATPase subunit delta
MAEQTTIARPYAQAAFRLAREGAAMEKWSRMLDVAATIAGDPAVRELIGNPRVTRGRLVELFMDIAGDRLDTQGWNFVRLVVENGRLAALPEIAALFETLRKEAEKSLDAEVVTAFPLTAEQRERISAVLTARTGRTVNLQQTVDPSLLGGAMIRSGDKVIDGSVTTQLDDMARALAG